MSATPLVLRSANFLAGTVFCSKVDEFEGHTQYINFVNRSLPRILPVCHTKPENPMRIGRSRAGCPAGGCVDRTSRSRALVVALMACLCCELQGFAPSVQSFLRTSGLEGGRAVCPASAHRLGVFAKARAGRAGGALWLRAADDTGGAEAGTESREGVKQTAEVLKLSDRWVLELDEQTGRPYYWNRKTSEVTRTFLSSASPPWRQH